MAITIYGVVPNIGEAEWSRLHAYLTLGNGQAQVVNNGLVCSVGVGTRAVAITSGAAAAAGVLAEANAAGTVNLAANGTGNPRIDLVVLQILWSGGATSGGTFTSVPGVAQVSPTAPDPQQDPGILWQIPLARVTVPAGATSITAGNIDDCRPLRRRAKEYSAAVVSTAVGTAGSDRPLCNIDIPDPGWQYLLYCSGRATASNVASGRLQCDIKVNGAQLQSGIGDSGLTADIDVIGRASGIQEGDSTVEFTATSVGLASQTTVSGGRLNVLLVPA